MDYCSSPNLAEENDFVPETVSFVFPPGSVNTICGEFQILSDNVALEGNEQFVVDLSLPFLMTLQGMESLDMGSFMSAANCTMSADVVVSSATITIIDTDGTKTFLLCVVIANYRQRTAIINIKFNTRRAINVVVSHILCIWSDDINFLHYTCSVDCKLLQ